MTARVALITGVSRPRGLGFAVAQQLAELGMRVVVSARDRDSARHLGQRLADRGLSVASTQLDVTDQSSIDACRAWIDSEYGVLDILINNAAGGFDIDQRVLDADLDIVRVAFEVNLLGPWSMCQAFLPLLERSDAGRIVNLSSEAGSFASPSGLTNPAIDGLIPGYSLSKSALNALTVKIAVALQHTRILVNAVCPGETATHPEDGDEAGARSPQASAAGVVWAATLPADGPTAGFFRDGIPLPW